MELWRFFLRNKWRLVAAFFVWSVEHFYSFLYIFFLLFSRTQAGRKENNTGNLFTCTWHTYTTVCLFQFVQIITDTFFISPKYTRNYFPFVWVFDIFGVHRKQRAQCTQVYCLSKFLLFRSFVVIVVVIINVLFLSIISNFGEGLGVTRKIYTKTEFD